MAVNANYRAKRTAGVGMVEPRLIELPRHVLPLDARGGRLGNQHKVPRVTNDSLPRRPPSRQRRLRLAGPRAARSVASGLNLARRSAGLSGRPMCAVQCRESAERSRR